MNAGKAGSLSQSVKAINLRNARVSRRNERRFNVPLRAFLEHKYPAIYSEYVDLFQIMSTAHPQQRKLTSTTTFRRWKENNSPAVIPPVCNNVLTQVLQETFATETPEQIRPQHDQQLPPPRQQDTHQSNHPHAHDMLPQNEDIQNPSHQDRPQEDENLQVEIDNIINQLEADEDIRDILAQPYPVGDEGISLDPFEEIHGDIHEFDYALEVGAFDD